MAVIKITVEVIDDLLNGAAKETGNMTVPVDQVLRDGKIMPEATRMVGNLAMMVYDSLAVGLAKKCVSLRL